MHRSADYAVRVVCMESDIFIDFYTANRWKEPSVRNYLQVTSLLQRWGVLLVFFPCSSETLRIDGFYELALEKVKAVLFWQFTGRQMDIVESVVRGVIALSTLFRKMDVWYENTATWS